MCGLPKWLILLNSGIFAPDFSVGTQMRLLKLQILIGFSLVFFVFHPAVFSKTLHKKMPVSGQYVPEMKSFDQAFSKLLKTWHIPGGSVAIMEKNKLFYARGFGWANLKTKETVQPDSLFRIASVSKAITAVAILKLIEQGKLNLNDKVFKVLNDLKPVNGKRINPKVYNMTVKHLLQMSSAWIPNGDRHFDPMFGPWSRYIVNIIGYDNLPATCKDTARMMMSFRLHGKPGSRYTYSNLDYCVLGLLVNKASGSPYGYKGYEQYVNHNILYPLNIKDMTIGSTQLKHKRPKEVTYYRYLGPIDISYQGVSTYLPYGTIEILQKNFSNGGWVASATDLVKFVHDVSNGKVLSKKMQDMMLSRSRLYKKKNSKYFAMGWKVKCNKGQCYWYQTGSFTGTNALVIRKSNGTAIAVMFNARPPIYNMWKHFRPRLKKILKTVEVDPLWQALALIPKTV